METLTINIPANVETKTVKAVLKALGVQMENAEKTAKKKNGVAKEAKKGRPYNPEYVAKILESKQQIAEGKTIRMTLDEIWK